MMCAGGCRCRTDCSTDLLTVCAGSAAAAAVAAVADDDDGDSRALA